jgi:predicted small metal-binding protein
VFCRAFVTESWISGELRVKEYAGPMRVIDCDCGKTIQAGSDEDLVRAVRAHADEAHADQGLSDEQVESLVAERAYEASDA